MLNVPEVENQKVVIDLAHRLIDNTASLYSVNSLTGYLLENLVFTALRRVSPEIYYCKTRSGLEVDFIALMPNRSRILVQVCESMAEAKTRKREVTALSEVMADLGLKFGTIVTQDEEDKIEVEAGTIEVIPAWRFLLNLPE